MFSTDDSIVAIATPPGHGGIGVVRISGPSATEIAEHILECPATLAPRRATLTRARSNALSPTGGTVDEVVATFFPEPRSYTGQDVVEISAHGSPAILHAIVHSAVAAGARVAEPGEFTLRAFLNGKRDLIQAEAVSDLVAAVTPLQARVAFDQLQGTLTEQIAEIDRPLFDLVARLEASLDFPDEGYHFANQSETATQIAASTSAIDALLAEAAAGRMIREGATVVIAGRTNVGKSSIFNKLTGCERAIVTEVAGTTRDLVTEQTEVGGLAITLVDTAGWRDTADVVEREGVTRAERARAVADLTIVVTDASQALTPDDERVLAQTADRRRIAVANKSDLEGAERGGAPGALRVSAKTGEGVSELRAEVVSALTGAEHLGDAARISNARHIALLEEARGHLTAAFAGAGAGVPEEFVLTDLQAARANLDEIVGRRTSDDVLRHIFERFCVGK